MHKLPDGSLIFSTAVRITCTDRTFTARQAIAPNPRDASYWVTLLRNSNEIKEGSIIAHDVETGLLLTHLSDTEPEPEPEPEDEETLWCVEQVR